MLPARHPVLIRKESIMALVQSEINRRDSSGPEPRRFRRPSWQRVALFSSMLLAFAGFYVSGSMGVGP
jgi:hypothetical protein